MLVGARLSSEVQVSLVDVVQVSGGGGADLTSHATSSLMEERAIISSGAPAYLWSHLADWLAS